MYHSDTDIPNSISSLHFCRERFASGVVELSCSCILKKPLIKVDETSRIHLTMTRFQSERRNTNTDFGSESSSIHDAHCITLKAKFNTSSFIFFFQHINSLGYYHLSTADKEVNNRYGYQWINTFKSASIKYKKKNFRHCD